MASPSVRIARLDAVKGDLQKLADPRGLAAAEQARLVKEAPVVVWLALVGLVVPVVLVERVSFRRSFGRALALGRADYVHAIGSLAALVVIFGVAEGVLALLLESQADNTVRTAIFLADLTLGPVLFLGGALLYVDQEARLRSRKRGKERNADLPDADDAHREGRPDAAREPGPSP